MVRKAHPKITESKDTKNFFDIYAESYTSGLTIWEDSYEKLYKPWLETTGEMLEKTTLISAGSMPQKYKEFYDEWIKTYHSTFGKIYNLPTLGSNKEILEIIISSADELNKLYRSWILELEKNNRITKDLLQCEPDPAKYKECYDAWMKSYEKIFEDFLSLPVHENMAEMFGNYMMIPDLYPGAFLQMSNLWKKSYTQAYKPMNESMLRLSEKLAEISRGETHPEKYKEFYTLWLDTYKELFGKYFVSQKPSKEMFKNFIENSNIYLSVYKSWISALEAMSGKAQEMYEKENGPEAYMEFYNLWMKTYIKAFESFFEDMPVVEGPMKDFMEPMKKMAKMYTDMLAKMSKIGISSRISPSSSYPGKKK